MQRRVLHADKMVAVKELIEFFHETSNILMQYGWTWHLENGRKITESFEAIKENGCDIPITGQGCEDTVYGSVIANMWLRFWHDTVHITTGLGFKLKEEREVIKNQMAVMELHGISKLAREIFWADMWGQALYYDRHHEFVRNQNAFVDSCLRHGIKTAIIAKH